MEQITGTLRARWRGAVVSIALQADSPAALVTEMERVLCELRRHDRQPNEASERWAKIRKVMRGDCPALELWGMWAARTGHGPDAPGLADFAQWMTGEGFCQTEVAAYGQIVQAELGA